MHILRLNDSSPLQEADLHGLGKSSNLAEAGEVFDAIFTPSRSEIKHRRSPVISTTSKNLCKLYRSNKLCNSKTFLLLDSDFLLFVTGFPVQ